MSLNPDGAGDRNRTHVTCAYFSGRNSFHVAARDRRALRAIDASMTFEEGTDVRRFIAGEHSLARAHSARCGRCARGSSDRPHGRPQTGVLSVRRTAVAALASCPGEPLALDGNHHCVFARDFGRLGAGSPTASVRCRDRIPVSSARRQATSCLVVVPRRGGFCVRIVTTYEVGLSVSPRLHDVALWRGTQNVIAIRRIQSSSLRCHDGVTSSGPPEARVLSPHGNPRPPSGRAYLSRPASTVGWSSPFACVPGRLHPPGRA